MERRFLHHDPEKTHRSSAAVHELRSEALQSCRHVAVTQRHEAPSLKALELIHLACLVDSSRHDFALHDRFWK